MPGRIDQLAGTGNGPAPIHRFETIHDLAEIFGDRQITACQFLQGPYAILSVVDRAELVQVQQVSQLASIDAVALVPGFYQRVLARISVGVEATPQTYDRLFREAEAFVKKQTGVKEPPITLICDVIDLMIRRLKAQQDTETGAVTFPEAN